MPELTKISDLFNSSEEVIGWILILFAMCAQAVMLYGWIALDLTLDRWYIPAVWGLLGLISFGIIRKYSVGNMSVSSHSEDH